MSITTKAFAVHLADPATSNFRAARRIIINVDILKLSKLCAGDIVLLTDHQTSEKDKLSSNFAVGSLWPSSDIAQDAIRVSCSLILTAKLKSGQKSRLIPLPTQVPAGLSLPSTRDLQDAGEVHLREITMSQASAGSDKGKMKDWLTLLARESLVDLKHITASQIIEIIFEGRSRLFVVSSVSPQYPPRTLSPTQELRDAVKNMSLETEKSKGHAIWIISWDTIVIIDPLEKAQNVEEIPEAVRSMAEDAYSVVGGLEKQIGEIRDLIEIPLTRPEIFGRFGLKPPRGILLYGPPGTGKTHLARAIAASTRSGVITVNGPELSSAYHGETESRLRDVFAEAKRKSPCIVVLDEVDALCPKREDGGGGDVDKRVVATLLTLMDGMDDGEGGGAKPRVVVVATTNRPNAIDPALRRPGRFDRELEIGIPDARARFSILKVLLKNTPHILPDDELRIIAAQTHGYVGADLGAIVREAGTRAIKRLLASQLQVDEEHLTLSDIMSALPTVRPSALRSVFLETPQVRWADIGGQARIRQRLQQSVEWPLLHPEAFVRLGISPPKGVLLYGPPGCSKTLTAKALATESGINFIAIKGPELLSKYVGESERAIREVFSKARAAAPCIIFFDEVDALGSSRSEANTNSHEGVLTSLLNEMDGIQELIGVTVVAATNRPDVIDSALMRPGRLDRILYVGPPDLQGREDIIKIRTRKMSVDPELDPTELAVLTEGCSGAEIVSMCQDAALLSMEQDINVPFVSKAHFLRAAKSIQRQITPEVVARFESWREKSGLANA